MLGQLILGKYRVARQIDEGGMSKIYLARQAAPARDVVVKVLEESLRSQSKTVEHFKREIYIMSRFRHPHTVAVFDSTIKDANGPVLVMEYLRGCDLNTLIQRDGRFTPERAGRLLAQLCDVLQAAHDAGIVHRDIKPGNVMILRVGTPLETVKLMDYGLAKMNTLLYISPDDLVDFSLPAASGTPEYISPEMVRGNDLDGRGDLYSVGVMLYEMLTGRRPFLHHSIEGLMLAHADDSPPSFAEIGLPDLVSPAIEAVVMSCLGKYPDDRPKNAWELAQAYEKALGRRILPARSSPAPSPRGVLAAPLAAPPTRPVDRNAVKLSVEASMPESMAMIKLKGFVNDLGGEVVESVPGLIKVRLREHTEKKGMFAWMGGGRPALQAVQSTDIELHMERLDPSQTSKLTITLVMRRRGGPATTDWKNHCNQITRDLQAYLMGR
jgi:eukaryotic-like serine/threonine-protein kinase